MRALLNQELDFLPEEIKNTLLRLEHLSPSFTSWTQRNLTKIKGKLRPISDLEDIKDVVSELTCAATILNSPLVTDLIYEPLGTSHRAPDFKVLLNNGEETYCEVRRIRRSATEMLRDDLLDMFRTKIQSIPLNYGVSIYCNELQIDGLSEQQVYQKLISELDNIILDIERKIREYERNNSLNETIELESYAFGLTIDVYKVPDNKADNRVHFYGALYNCPTTGREYAKFSDVIFDKLEQLVPNANNIIFVIVSNDSHEFEDLMDSIESINDLIKSENEEFFRSKGYNDKNHFLLESQKLGGVVVQDRAGEIRLWVNGSAVHKLSEELVAFIKDLLLEKGNGA